MVLQNNTAMALRLRRYLITFAALLVYSSINVVAGAAHHHLPEAESTGWNAASVSDANLPTQEPADDQHDDGEDDDEACLICNVLHLAQKPPILFHLEATSILIGTAVCPAAVFRSYPLQSTVHSRAPPLS